jgi:hypothetical protein
MHGPIQLHFNSNRPAREISTASGWLEGARITGAFVQLYLYNLCRPGLCRLIRTCELLIPPSTGVALDGAEPSKLEDMIDGGGKLGLLA